MKKFIFFIISFILFMPCNYAYSSNYIDPYPQIVNENKIFSLNKEYWNNLVSPSELLSAKPEYYRKRSSNLSSGSTFVIFILFILFVISIIKTLKQEAEDQKKHVAFRAELIKSKTAKKSKPKKNKFNFPSTINPAFLAILMNSTNENLLIIIFLELIRKGAISIDINHTFNPALNVNEVSEYIITTHTINTYLYPHEIEFLKGLRDLESLGTVYLGDLKNLKSYNLFNSVKKTCLDDYQTFVSNRTEKNDNLRNIQNEKLFANKWRKLSKSLCTYTPNDLDKLSMTNLEKLNIYSFALDINITSRNIEKILPCDLEEKSPYFKSILNTLNECNRTSSYKSILDYVIYILKF